MGEQLEMTASLINEKVQFSAVCGANEPVTIDYKAPIGDGQGYTPLELLLMSLASCTGATVATLLRRMRKEISGLEVHATGIRRDEHPTCFHAITLQFVVQSADCVEADIRRALQLSEETYCPVWAMVRDNVTIRTEYRIVTPCHDQTDG